MGKSLNGPRYLRQWSCQSCRSSAFPWMSWIPNKLAECVGRGNRACTVQQNVLLQRNDVTFHFGPAVGRPSQRASHSSHAVDFRLRGVSLNRRNPFPHSRMLPTSKSRLLALSLVALLLLGGTVA